MYARIREIQQVQRQCGWHIECVSFLNNWSNYTPTLPKAAKLVNKFIQIMVEEDEEEKMTLNNELDIKKNCKLPFMVTRKGLFKST